MGNYPLGYRRVSRDVFKVSVKSPDVASERQVGNEKAIASSLAKEINQSKKDGVGQGEHRLVEIAAQAWRGKRGVEGDVDFLREALQVLLESIMDAEVGLSKKSAIVPTSADRPSIPR